MHKCVNKRLTDKEFEEWQTRLSKSLTAVIMNCQEELIKNNICEIDFIELLTTFGIQHLVSTIQFVASQGVLDKPKLVSRIIEAVAEATNTVYINTEMVKAEAEKRLSTIQ